jgi:membrane-associated phospholipid phosphatase
VSDSAATASHARAIAFRIVITAVAVATWFWTQSFIGARLIPRVGINDALHNLLAPLNDYFSSSPCAANALLIVSSALIDALGLFLIGRWIFQASIRPLLSLVLLLGLRQVMQVLCALPAPPNMIWHYPGFPSLFVTYNIGNDYYFSGHTGIAVLGALELARLRRNWLTAFGLAVVAFEIAAVLTLRVHYTMDVFTGVIAALWVATLCDALAPKLDPFLFSSH